ncbi:MAG: CHAT domain-containing protein [Pseudomonadota bacterium]
MATDEAWLCAYRGDVEESFDRQHPAETLESLRVELLKLDFRDPQQRITAAVLRSDLAWYLSAADQHERAVFWAQLSLAGLPSDPAYDDDYITAAKTTGFSLWFLARPKEAASFYRMALDRLCRSSTPRSGTEGQLRTNLAIVLRKLGELDAAAQEYERAVLRLSGTKYDEQRAATQRAFGLALMDDGRFELAADLLDQARENSLSMPLSAMKWYVDRAQLSAMRGQLNKALSDYGAALEIYREIDSEVGGNLATLTNAALLDLEFGRTEAARFRLAEAERLSARHPTPLQSRMALLRARANIEAAEGLHSVALRTWQSLRQLIADRAQANAQELAEADMEIARLLSARGDSHAARLRLAQTIGDKRNVLPVHAVGPAILLAELDLAAGETEQARSLLTRAAEAEFSRKYPDQLWRVFSGLARAAAAQGRRAAAILFGKLAVDQIHEIVRPVQGTRGGAKFYLKKRLHAHRELIDWLARDGHLQGALEIERMIKQEKASELARRNRSVASDFSPTSKAPNETAAVLRLSEIVETAVQTADVVSDWRREPVVRQVARRTLGSVRKQITETIDDIFDNHSTVSLAPPDVVTTSSSSRPTITYVCGNDTVTIYASNAGASRVVTPDESFGDIARKIFDLQVAIEAKADVTPNASWLFEILIGPVIDLMADATHLDIVPSGAIAHVPFACLFDGESFLAERFSTTIVTGAKTKEPTTARERWRAAAFVNTLPGTGFAPLQHARREVASLHALIRNSQIRFDGDVTTDNIVRALKSGYELVHLAMHFAIKPHAPHMSHLQTGSGDPLYLEELADAVGHMSEVELLVLSCCDTGSADMGEFGPDSLAIRAQQLGAQDVIGTLWPVSDASMADLLDRFYGMLLSDDQQLKIAEAVQRAQLTVLNAEDMDRRGSSKRGIGCAGPVNRGSAHPYDWAGIVHYGRASRSE